MQKLTFLHSAHRLMLIDICMKFREDSLRGFQVTEQTRFVTDRQTDGHPDRRTPGEKQYVSQPFGGDIIEVTSLVRIQESQNLFHLAVMEKYVSDANQLRK